MRSCRCCRTAMQRGGVSQITRGAQRTFDTRERRFRNGKGNIHSGILIIMLVITILTACGTQGEQKETMVIKPSEFSEETQDVLKIMDDEIAFFDYTVDETIKSMKIDIWEYKDGEWISSGGTSGNLESRDGRIAVRANEATYDIFEIVETGNVKTSYKSTVDFEKCVTKIASTLQRSTKIEPEKEISLWVKLGYNTTQAVSPGTAGNFREADCDAGLVMTAVFSTETVE
ncbi:MAG: hypothetical protein E6X19_13170 [Hungatella hathewayi]|nr:hypothetical protein [Hungatella hathewayi]MDU4973653.1 hypothetical protein [Hungatella hathewayi]